MKEKQSSESAAPWPAAPFHSAISSWKIPCLDSSGYFSFSPTPLTLLSSTGSVVPIQYPSDPS